MDSFLFVCCQVGAEKALKRDLATYHPQLKFAFSRPGFVTFKAIESVDLQQPLKSPFVRSCAQSVGSAKIPSIAEDVHLQQLIDALPAQQYRHLHVWRRDENVPGENGFEPFHRPESLELGNRLKSMATEESSLRNAAVNRTARNDDLVADIIQVDPEQWFVGWHRATSIPSRWPGGVPPLRPKEDMISRAYLKMQEALRWSQLPLTEGDACVELGSSPGGSCLALAERGMNVVGIDPALMDERLLTFPNFTHIRARAADLKRREFAATKWLFSDANIAPQNTLDAIEGIVTHRTVNIQAMLITVKLLTWEMATHIDECVQRIQSWGYRHVRVRQLAFNRREVCVLAAKNKTRLRLSRKSQS